MLLNASNALPIPWPGMALGAAREQQYHEQMFFNQMLLRFLYSGKIIGFHNSFKYESSQQFSDREICTSCGRQSIKEEREPHRAGPWDRNPEGSRKYVPIVLAGIMPRGG